MGKLDNLLESIEAYDAEVFNYNRDLHKLCDDFNELLFFGEIDHGIYYFTQLEQIYRCDSNGCNQLYTLTKADKERYYTKGKLPEEICCWKIACSVHWYVNVKENYVKVLVNRDVLKQIGQPKEDYGKVFEDFMKKKWSETAQFKLDEIDDDIIKNVFAKLIKVMEFSKFHTLPQGNWDLKVQQDMSQFYGNPIKGIVNDELQETSRPELIKIPHPHNKIRISQFDDLHALLNAPGFDDIDWNNEKNFNKTFKNSVDAENLFYSIIDYINEAKIQPTYHPAHDPQYIKSVEKHYLSELWPIAKNEEESEQLEKELTKYEVNVTKFHDSVVLRLQIWEFGIVTFTTNMWTSGTMN